VSRDEIDEDRRLCNCTAASAALRVQTFLEANYSAGHRRCNNKARQNNGYRLTADGMIMAVKFLGGERLIPMLQKRGAVTSARRANWS
jgi:hypothetical protein